MLLSLQSSDFVRYLDVGTKEYDSTGSGDVKSTWAGLISSVMVCVTSELEDDKHTTDRNTFSLLRTCVAAAEGRKRTNGISVPLLRRAGKMFAHVLIVLQSGDANFVVDYVHILRNNLLNVPEYCSRAKQSVFEELIKLFASKSTSSSSEAMNGEKKEELYRGAAAFYLLLRNCPYDLSVQTVNGLMETFKDTFHNLREDGRTAAMLVSAMNKFLLKTGLDVSSRMAALHDSVYPYLAWALKGNVRDRRLKEELIKYCYVQNRLDVLGHESVENLVEVLEKQIDDIGSDRSVGGNNSDRFDVKLSQKLLFELYCDVLVFSERTTSTVSSDMNQITRSAKRARGDGKHVERIVSKILSDGGYWGAVFCVLLQRHGGSLAKPELYDCTNRLVIALSDSFSQGSMSDMKVLAHSLWLIRCLQEIAGGTRNNASPVWTKVTNCLVYWLPAHLAEARLTNESLLLFATMVSSELIHPSLLRQKFWQLSVFDFAEVPTLATLELVSAVSSLGLSEHVVAGRSYDEYFLWLLRGLSQKTDERFSFYGRRANASTTSDVALDRVLSAIQNSFVAASHRAWIDKEDRSWLESPDDDHVSFMRDVENLRLVSKPFAKFGFNPKRADDVTTVNSSSKEVSMDPEIRITGAQMLEKAIGAARNPTDAVRVCTVALGAITSLAPINRRTEFMQSLDQGGNASLMKTIFATIPRALRIGLHLDTILSSKTTVLDAIPTLVSTLRQVQHAGCKSEALEDLCRNVVEILYDIARELLQNIDHGLTVGSNSVMTSARHSQEETFFDDDLDFQMVDSEAQRSNTSQMATTSTTIMPENDGNVACSERYVKQIMKCLESMTSVIPESVATLTALLLRYAVPPEGAPPRGPCGIGVSQDIAEVAISLVQSSRSASLVGVVLPVLQAVARGQVNLDENAGLMSSAREWLLNQTTILTYGLCELTSSNSNCEMPPIPENTHGVLADLVTRAAGVVDGEIPAALRNCDVRAKLADCILSLFTYEMDYFQPRFGGCLAWLLGDDSYLVRIHAGYAMASAIGFFLEADHTSIFQNTVVPGLAIKCQFLPSGGLDIATDNIDDTEREWSSLHIISAVGIISSVLEPWCAFMIIHHRARHGSRLQIPAMNAIIHLAESTGHPSVASFVQFHNRTIGRLWIDSGASVSLLFEVPEVLGLPPGTDAKTVAAQLKRSLLPALIYDKDRDGLNTLAAMSDSGTIQQMIKLNWDVVQARLYALVAKDCPDPKAIAAQTYVESLMKKSIRGWKPNDSSNQLQILVELLHLARDPVESAKLFDVSPPYRRATDIIHVIERFMNEQDSTITWTFDVIFQCMLSIHEAIDMATSSRHKLKVLASLKVLLSCIGEENVRIPSLFRYVYFMLIPNLNDNTIGTQCIQILAKQTLSAYDELNRLNEDQSELSFTMENFIVPLMFVLSSVVESDASSVDQRTEAQNFLRIIVTKPPKSIYRVLGVLPPLPDLPMLKDVRDILLNVDKPSHAERLSYLVEKAPTLPKALQRVALRAGGLEALTHKKYLLKMSDEEDFSPYEWSCTISEHVWKFAELVAPLADAELFSIAAELVSSLGPLRPQVLAFIPPEQKLPFGGKDFVVGMTQLEMFVVKNLKYLSSLLCSPKSSTVRSAAATIQGLFTIKKVCATHQKIPETERFYLAPFATEALTVPAVESVCVKSMVSDLYELDDERLWTINENGSDKAYENWICALVHRLLPECKADPLFRLLESLMISDYVVAELALPHMLFEIADARHDLSVKGNKDVHDALSRGFTGTLNRANTSEGRRAAKFILRTFEYLRRKRTTAFRAKRPDEPSERRSRARDPAKWKKIFWFDIDYLTVAQAAIHTEAPLTAVMFVEYWLEEKGDSVSLNVGDSHGQMSDSVPEHLSLLLKAQSKLSEPDGLYGLLCSNSLELQLRLSEHEGHWDRALAGYDLLRSSGENIGTHDGQHSVPMMRSLRELGCSHLLRAYSKALSDDELAAPEMKELQYEAAWRAGIWTLPTGITRTQHSTTSEFNQSLHAALRALDRNDTACAIYETNRSRAHILEKAISEQAESADAMNVTIMKLRMLDDIRDAAQLWRYFDSDADVEVKKRALISMNDCWRSRHVKDAPFKLIEQSLALQGILFQLAGLYDNYAQHMTRTSMLARKAGHITEGVQAIRNLRIMHGRDQTKSDMISLGTSPWRVEEAKLLWAEGKSEAAISVVNSIVQSMRPGQNLLLSSPKRSENASAPPSARFFELVCLLSKWQARARSESSKVILSKFLDCVSGMTAAYADIMKGKGVHEAKCAVIYSKDGLNDVTSVRLLSRVHFRLAQFTDAQYRHLEDRLKSPEWARYERLRKRNEDELVRLKCEKDTKYLALVGKKKGTGAYEAIANEINSITGRVYPLERQVSNDREEAMGMHGEHRNALITALQGYRRSLEAGGWNAQETVFRMISLWFTHCAGVSTNSLSGGTLTSAVNGEIEKLITRGARIPSQIFLELSHQIISRLGTPCNAENNFIQLLEHLVFRLIRDHPYHVIYQIQALTRGDRVSRAGVRSPSEKIAAAKRLLEKYGSKYPEKRMMLSQMERLIEAYIRIATMSLSSNNETPWEQLPSDVKKRALSDLKMVPVLTAPLAIDPKCEYADGTFPYFSHFGDTARLVGGINVPKVVSCYGSNGKIYHQLAKSGNDDLRQDAVIQQFFGLVNTLLKRNLSTNSRRMRIRTYKVIPFSPEAGLLEYVDESILLSSYLIRAHERYRPCDMKHGDISRLMKGLPPSELHKTYEEVCANFRPVMHNFFLENFPDPSNWFEKRVAYTRSCAVNSIVGYVIGLGDRHSSNIMIDRWTAEFVHIDFGVTFEQGLTLKTPERVPFRLTRDIVDGMGACGVEGIMRRCCEETMKVLRSNRDALTTIIAVLVHDPIIKWAVGGRQDAAASSKHYNGMGDSPVHADEGNLDAKRALMRVKQKLDGYEDGELRSIQGQVQQLLHDARDPHKLALMYAGWAAWL